MQNHPSLRKSYARCNDPAKRGSVCEAFEKKPLPLALTLILRYVPNDPSYWAKIVSDNRPIDWANGERVGDPGKLSRHGRFPGHAGLTVCACIRFACVIRSGYLVLANQHTSSEGQGSRDLRQPRVEPY